MPVYNATEFQRVLEFVRANRAQRAQEIVIGRCKSWDEYTRDVAYVRAMDDVESEIAKITGTEENLAEKDVS